MPETGYVVQFCMPVDNPVNNVRKRREKGVVIFDVPINFPNIHNLTYVQLYLASEETAKSATFHRP